VVLGVLLLVLGVQMCRGNALGDRLRAGGALVEETDQLVQAGVAAVAAAYAEGTAALDLATAHRARGDEARTAVARLHWEAVQHAALLLGVDRPPIPRDDEGFARPLPVLADADATTRAARTALAGVAAWLRCAQAATPPRAELEATGSRAGVVELGAWDGSLLSGSRSMIRGPRVDRPAPPREPRWLVALGAVLTVAAAVTAAQLTSPPSAGSLDTTVTVDGE
jgi:hypothetical protein